MLDVSILDAGTLFAILSKETGRCVMLSHPLWRSEERFFNDIQADAFEDLRDQGADMIVSRSLYELNKTPFSVYQALSA